MSHCATQRKTKQKYNQYLPSFENEEISAVSGHLTVHLTTVSGGYRFNFYFNRGKTPFAPKIHYMKKEIIKFYNSSDFVIF